MSSNAAASRRLSSGMNATAKRPAMTENAGGAKAAAPHAAAQQAKKRVALGNITNVAAGGRAGSGKVAPPAGNVRLNLVTSTTPVKKGSTPSVRNVSASVKRGSTPSVRNVSASVKRGSTPSVRNVSASVKRGSTPSVRNVSASVKKGSMSSVRNVSASVKKGSMPSVWNVSASLNCTVKPAPTKPAPAISRHENTTRKETYPLHKRLNSVTSTPPVKKGSMPSVWNVSASRGCAVKPVTSTTPVKKGSTSSVRNVSAIVKKGSMPSVRNVSASRGCAVKPVTSTTPVKKGSTPSVRNVSAIVKKGSMPSVRNVSASHGCAVKPVTSTTPVKKGSMPSVRNVSASRDGAVKPAPTKPAPVISRYENTTRKETYPLHKRLNSVTSISPVKKESMPSVRNVSASRGCTVKPSPTKPAPAISRHENTTRKETYPLHKVLTVAPIVAPVHVPCCSFLSSGRSGDSISTDETMSTCDSMKSPDFEYIDNGDSSVLDSLQRLANENLRISEDRDAQGTNWKKDAPALMEIDNVCDVDDNYEDPQLCATLASDIYMHLREAETRKRPATDFLETIQKDINPSMRAILIDWLVEVAEEYRLVPDTLYLTVNYIDRYLSGKEINRERLQLLGVACMLIAAKYEEICAPQVDEFCYITDNTYLKDEVLEMETSVLNYLKFEMTAPTAKCFLRRFARAAQVCDEDPALHLEFLANYVAELSLLDCSLLSYPPSLVAASAIFLSKFILQPTKHPWNSTLAHYTQYKPSELCDCVKALHRLFSAGPGSNLPAIREKYSQDKYKFVGRKQCPSSVPTEFFRDQKC